MVKEVCEAIPFWAKGLIGTSPSREQVVEAYSDLLNANYDMNFGSVAWQNMWIDSVHEKLNEGSIIGGGSIMRKDSYRKGLEAVADLDHTVGINLLGYRNKLVARNICPVATYNNLIDVCDMKRIRLSEYRKDWILSTRDGRGCPKPIAMRLRSEGWE